MKHGGSRVVAVMRVILRSTTPLRKTMKSILDIIKPIRLTVGHSSDPSKGSCVMDVVSYINGDRNVTDHPECACPVITAFAIRINDRLADADRQKLLGYVTRIAGSRAGRDITVQRALMCANFAKRQAAIADFVKCYAAADRATLASLVDRFADAGSAAADTADYSAARLGDADVAKRFAAEAADYAADADECAVNANTAAGLSAQHAANTTKCSAWYAAASESALESAESANHAKLAIANADAAVRYADSAVRSVDAGFAAMYAVNAADFAADAANDAARLAVRLADAGYAVVDMGADYSAARLGDADVAKYAARAANAVECAKESKHYAARANTVSDAAVAAANAAVRSTNPGWAAVHAVNAAEKAASAAGYAYYAADASADASADAAANSAVMYAGYPAAVAAANADFSAMYAADAADFASARVGDADVAKYFAARAADADAHAHAASAAFSAAGRSPADVHYVTAVMAHLEDMLQLTDDAPVDAPMIARAEQLVLVNVSKVTS